LFVCRLYMGYLHHMMSRCLFHLICNVPIRIILILHLICYDIHLLKHLDLYRGWMPRMSIE
jgi:hypothetical protein